MCLSPLSSYYQLASRNLVFSNFPDPTIQPDASANEWLLPMLPNGTETSLDTQIGYSKCLGYQPLMDLDMER